MQHRLLLACIDGHAGTGVGVRVGKGVGVGTGVGVTWRVGTRDAARLTPMVTMTSTLMIHMVIRVRRDFALRTLPPVRNWVLTCHYSTAMWIHKHPGHAEIYASRPALLLTLKLAPNR